MISHTLKIVRNKNALEISFYYYGTSIYFFSKQEEDAWDTK